MLAKEQYFVQAEEQYFFAGIGKRENKADTDTKFLQMYRKCLDSFADRYIFGQCVSVKALKLLIPIQKALICIGNTGFFPDTDTRL